LIPKQIKVISQSREVAVILNKEHFIFGQKKELDIHELEAKDIHILFRHFNEHM